MSKWTSFFISCLLLLLIIGVASATAYSVAWLAQGSGIQNGEVTESENRSPALLQSAVPDKAEEPASLRLEDIPAWLIVLLGSFVIIQVLVLLPAARLASSSRLGEREVQLISFLCESPMYLGLLGSLTGVCLSQFIDGTLSAPLAYLTTISGIVLFMLAKLTIWTSLPPTVTTHRDLV